MKKKLLSALLIASVLLSAGCKKGTTNSGSDAFGAEVWTAAGTEKLLQDLDYSYRYDNNLLTIKAFRNEYESAQIMISSTGGKDYEVETSDLTSANGEKLSADAFTLYHQKYVRVTKIRDVNSPTSLGWYPDALVPLDAATEYGDNVLAAGNQGVWVTLKVPNEQAAGNYSGTFTVKLGNDSYQVPVSVTVYDYTLSDVVHSKSSFALAYEYLGWGELDTSVEMQEAYYEALLEYRINGEHLPGNELVYVNPEGEALERFLYYADKYTRDVRCTSFNLPFTMSTAMYEGKEIKSVDFQKFKVLLREMATYSAANNVNLFEKAATYFIFFDEYDLNGSEDTANYNLNTAVAVCREISEELAETLECEDAELREAILEGVAKIKHKVVGSLTDGLQVEAATSVPLISKYHTEGGREMYRDFATECYGEDAELWAYTCLEPRTPYPTYHIEDILTSSRIMSWMMYDYDIVGNLYWCTNLYAWRESAFGDYGLQDYYDTPMRYPNTNGDGFLFYPGRDYGIYGPVGTLRLHSIRDGSEDYDLLYALEEQYTKYGVTEETFNSLYSFMSRNLYTGTMVRIRNELLNYFDASRDLLANLLELAYNANTVIKDIRPGNGTMAIDVETDNDCVVNYKGEKLTPVQSGNRATYTINVSMTETENYCNLTVTKGEKTYNLNMALGGKNLIVNAADYVAKTTVVSGGEVSVDTIDGASALKISYNEGARLIAQMDVENLGIDENVGNVTLNIYSYSDEPVSLKLLSKCKTSQQFIESDSITLKKGWNKIVIPTTAFNCANYGVLTTVRYNINSTSATQIAVGNIEIGG